MLPTFYMHGERGQSFCTNQRPMVLPSRYKVVAGTNEFVYRAWNPVA
jgi:hypothetical protein